MKQNKVQKIILALLVLICLMASLCTSFAANDCHLTVNVRSEDGTRGISDFQVNLCNIALSKNGIYGLSDAFQSSGLRIPSLLGTHSADAAKDVHKYIKDNSIPVSSLGTDQEGRAIYTNLQRGIYIVFATEGQSVYFDPFIVVLPLSINGVNNHYVTSVPKTTDRDDGADETLRRVFVRVIWDDQDNKYGKRPQSVTVTLLRDSQTLNLTNASSTIRQGVPYSKAVIDSTADWKHTFEIPFDYASYSVLQNNVPEYETTYSGNVDSGFIIVNKYIGEEPDTPPAQEKASIGVIKQWDDEDNKSGKRPESITVQLIKDGSVIKTASLSEDNLWKHTFTELSKSAKYTVKEILPADYSVTYSGDTIYGFTITNKYTQGTTDPGVIPEPEYPGEPKTVNISAKILWEDAENIDGTRPAAVKLSLIANSSVIKAITVTESDGWKCVFENLPANLEYTVLQEAIEQYSTAYSGNATDGFVIVNKYTPEGADPGTPPDPTKPDTPNEPDNPDDPADNPDGQDKTDPNAPSIPQTGFNTLPIYILMALGALMVVIGTVDMFLMRDEK